MAVTTAIINQVFFKMVKTTQTKQLKWSTMVKTTDNSPKNLKKAVKAASNDHNVIKTSKEPQKSGKATHKHKKMRKTPKGI